MPVGKPAEKPKRKKSFTNSPTTPVGMGVSIPGKRVNKSGAEKVKTAAQIVTAFALAGPVSYANIVAGLSNKFAEKYPLPTWDDRNAKNNGTKLNRKTILTNYLNNG